MTFDHRTTHLFNWLNQQVTDPIEDFQLISGDASFRRYFRFSYQGQHYIGVDAPPETEDNPMFIAVANEFSKAKIHCPTVIYSNLEYGFLWLSDLGSTHLADIIDQTNFSKLYEQCLAVLPKFQQIDHTDLGPIPSYDVKLVQFELSIFFEWLIEKLLAIKLTQDEQLLIEHTNNLLTETFLNQPQAFVHRDFHSRNLMPSQDSHSAIAVIDFQGALIGPVTYDVVSLLKDCYIKWPDNDIQQLSQQHRAKYHPQIPAEQWQQYFDWVGMQRHLKAAGIFARLHLRDGKSNYLADIPRTLSYIIATSKVYPELQPFGQWLETNVQPLLMKKI